MFKLPNGIWISDPRKGPVCCERCGSVLTLRINFEGKPYLETFATLVPHEIIFCDNVRRYRLILLEDSNKLEGDYTG